MFVQQQTISDSYPFDDSIFSIYFRRSSAVKSLKNLSYTFV